MVAIKPAALLLFLFIALPASAQELAPGELVRKVTGDVPAAIKSDKELQAGDRKKALALRAGRVLQRPSYRLPSSLAAPRAFTVTAARSAVNSTPHTPISTASARASSVFGARSP